MGVQCCAISRLTAVSQQLLHPDGLSAVYILSRSVFHATNVKYPVENKICVLSLKWKRRKKATFTNWRGQCGNDQWGKCLKEQQLPNSDGWMLAHFQPFPPSCLTVLLTKKSKNARCCLFTFPIMTVSTVPNLPESDLLARFRTKLITNKLQMGSLQRSLAI